jgi:putative transposase
MPGNSMACIRRRRIAVTEGVGHLFQGRYKAILVDGDAYLLELTRYVVLNPVRAGMVKHPGEWFWSSFRAMTRQSKVPPWLATEGLLAQFSPERTEAVRRYVQFVDEGAQEESIWKDLNRQIFLGDDRFVTRMQAMRESLPDTVGVPLAQQRSPAPPLAALTSELPNRDEAIVAAYATGEYSYQEIAEFFGLHFTTVGKIVRAARKP